MITYPQISPTFLTIGPVELRWYGLMYAASFLIGYGILRNLLKTKRFEKIGIKAEDLYDMLFFVLLGVVLGGRLGYVLFYNFPYYLGNPLQIFAVWEGGMSFHGGLIGVAICGWIFCRLKKIRLADLADLLSVVVPLGLGLGRLGNFINAELYGRISDVPWCMEFPNIPGCRHPSQLYEFFLEGVVLFIIMQILVRRNVQRGVLFFIFLLCYGIFRSFVEFFREPDLQIGFLPLGLTMGQLLSIPLILIGIAGLLIMRKKVRQSDTLPGLEKP